MERFDKPYITSYFLMVRITTSSQGTREPANTLYVLCGLQEGIRLYLP